MSEMDLLWAVCGVGDDLLQEAMEAKPVRRRFPFAAVAAAAACLMLCVGGLFLRFGPRMGSAAPGLAPMQSEPSQSSGNAQWTQPEPMPGMPQESAPSSDPGAFQEGKGREQQAEYTLGVVALGDSESWVRTQFGEPEAESNFRENDSDGTLRMCLWYGEGRGLRLDLVVRPEEDKAVEAVVSGIYLSDADAFPGLVEEQSGEEIQVGDSLSRVLEVYPQQDKTAIGDTYTVPLDGTGNTSATFYLKDRTVTAIYLGELYPGNGDARPQPPTEPPYSLESDTLTVWSRENGEWVSRDFSGWQETKYLITMLNIEDLRFDGEAYLSEDVLFVDLHNGTVLSFAAEGGDTGKILRWEGMFTPDCKAELLYDGVTFPQGTRDAIEDMLG